MNRGKLSLFIPKAFVVAFRLKENLKLMDIYRQVFNCYLSTGGHISERKADVTKILIIIIVALDVSPL